MEKDMEMKGKVMLYEGLHDYLSRLLLALVAIATVRAKHLNNFCTFPSTERRFALS